MGKLKNFYITTSLGENEVYLEGSIVEGSVVTDLSKSKVISGPIQIVLSGQARVQWRAAPRLQDTLLVDRSLSSDTQRIINDMTVTSHQQWNTGESETLLAGVHEFPFTFQLPANISLSLEGDHLQGNIQGYI